VIARLLGTAVLAAVLQSQPSFEVASIKQNRSNSAAWSMTMPPGGRFNFSNATPDTIIRWAYRLQDLQLAGMPSWASSARFDVVARSESTPPPDEARMQSMMQTLLAERFKLVAHREARELPIYALVLARADRQPGPALRSSQVDCAAVAAAARTSTPPPLGNRPLCGVRMGSGSMIAGGLTMPRLVANLTRVVDRIVVDRTNLAGAFDIDLHWAPEQSSPDAAPVDPNAPSIFTAMQEQLGLKLDSTRAPVDVLVIDHVERPAED
jgi:uncharacterized protein (TIGR03435 family)